jgi:hypothetical protein
MTTARRILLPGIVFATLGLFDASPAQNVPPKQYWVFLNQRTITNATPQELGISERALKRRSKVLPPDRLIDALDYPVPQSILDEIRSTGAVIRTTSRWLNAVSVTTSGNQLQAVSALPFVKQPSIYRSFTPSASSVRVSWSE